MYMEDGGEGFFEDCEDSSRENVVPSQSAQKEQSAMPSWRFFMFWTTTEIKQSDSYCVGGRLNRSDFWTVTAHHRWSVEMLALVSGFTHAFFIFKLIYWSANSFDCLWNNYVCFRRISRCCCCCSCCCCCCCCSSSSSSSSSSSFSSFPRLLPNSSFNFFLAELFSKHFRNLKFRLYATLTNSLYLFMHIRIYYTVYASFGW